MPDAQLFITDTKISRTSVEIHGNKISLTDCSFIKRPEIDIHFIARLNSRLSNVHLCPNVKRSDLLVFDARKHLTGTTFDALGDRINYCQLHDEGDHPWLKIGDSILPVEELTLHIEELDATDTISLRYQALIDYLARSPQPE